MSEHRLSPSVMLIAATLNSLPDSKARFLEPLGGRVAVAKILVKAANRLLRQENIEAAVSVEP